MAFKQLEEADPITDSPEKLILEFPRRKIPDVLPHQRDILKEYNDKAINLSDVALELPTGSGKTLVGLLIAEWLRRKNGERVVYLCPTKQLVNQVVSQASEKYGLTVLGFTGPRGDYSPSLKAEYKNAKHIAVTTYSSLFNTNPFFKDADVVIVDDVHAAENYVASMWSLQINRNDSDHLALHTALCGILKSSLSPINYARLTGNWDNPADKAWVDKIPTRIFTEMIDDITEVVEAHVTGSDLSYPWSMIKENLWSCQLYVSSNEILIRPIIPPTWTHDAFTKPRQRIYMSATLGAGGDLERLMGRKSITRLSVPAGWDNQGVGRRFFMFPEMSLKNEEVEKLRFELMKEAKRSLVLAPNNKSQEILSKSIEDTLKFPTFNAESIEISKKPFLDEESAVVVVSNRYDGIDFPGEECRLIFVENMTKATNLQERFIMSRMGATVLYNERIQTRALQAIGRCTRSLEDYSGVVVTGDELPDYLASLSKRKYLHPELQAELSFGISQSTSMSLSDFVENFKVFLENGEDWEKINQQIISERKKSKRVPFPSIDNLADVVGYEIEYQMNLWQGDFVNAISLAEKVIAGLTDPDLKGYRALWHYLAGSAAWLESMSNSRFKTKARRHFESAKEAAPGIPWLVELAKDDAEESKPSKASKEVELLEQVERIESILGTLGTLHDRNYSKREKEIIEGILTGDSRAFEHSQKLLGELLGFESGKEESEGSPDPWWLTGNMCLVFEDHTDAEDSTILSVSKARQVSGHPAWMRSNVEASAGVDILPVLITPVNKVRKGAIPHLSGVSLWPLDDFREWTKSTLHIIRGIRKTFTEPGDLNWRIQAAKSLKSNNLSGNQLFDLLRKKEAIKLLTEI